MRAVQSLSSGHSRGRITELDGAAVAARDTSERGTATETGHSTPSVPIPPGVDAPRRAYRSASQMGHAASSPASPDGFGAPGGLSPIREAVDGVHGSRPTTPLAAYGYVRDVGTGAFGQVRTARSVESAVDAVLTANGRCRRVSPFVRAGRVSTRAFHWRPVGTQNIRPRLDAHYCRSCRTRMQRRGTPRGGGGDHWVVGR